MTRIFTVVYGSALLVASGQYAVSMSLTPVPQGASSAGMPPAVVDPIGDASKMASGAHDIVRAAVIRGMDALTFTIEVAAPLAQQSAIPEGWDALVWGCLIDSDRSTSPAGYPAPEKVAIPVEFAIERRLYREGAGDPIDASADGVILIDRRPLLTGGRPRGVPVAANIDGSKLTLVVPVGVLDDPKEFDWSCMTAVGRPLQRSENTWSIQVIDRAPDKGVATWRAER